VSVVTLGLLLGAGLFCGAGRAASADPPATGGQTTPANPAAQPAPAPVTDPDYLIGVGDVINMFAIGHDDLSQTLMVLSDGKLSVAGVNGQIKAAGMTIQQLQMELQKRLDRLYNNLEVTVEIKESHSHNVTIQGARASGQFPLMKDWTVSSLIAAAGGLTGKTKYTVGNLIRKDADGKVKVIKLDIPKIVGPTPDTAADLPLKVDDMVVLDTLEEANPTYSVVGAVQKPGNYPLPKDGAPVIAARALADAGGPTDSATLTRGSILRHGQKIGLNLFPLLFRGDAETPAAKVEMQDGDVMVIPASLERYMVLGQVNRPGAFPLPDYKKTTLLQGVAEAGGATQVAEFRNVILRHMVDGKPTYTHYDIQKMITDKDDKSLSGIEIKDGDVIFIPVKGRSFQVNDLLSPVQSLYFLGLRPFGF
jgi:protein involved in polysaccharide export with SLBB domain